MKYLTIAILSIGCTQISSENSKGSNSGDSMNVAAIESEHAIDSQKPIQIIEEIFYNYVEFEDHTDSEEDKRAMVLALEQCDSTLSIADLTIIINVWMYYDPVDFSTSDLTIGVLKRNKANALIAIDQRIKNKMEWEEEGIAPYDDLPYLKEKVKSEP